MRIPPSIPPWLSTLRRLARQVLGLPALRIQVYTRPVGVVTRSECPADLLPWERERLLHHLRVHLQMLEADWAPRPEGSTEDRPN